MLLKFNAYHQLNTPLFVCRGLFIIILKVYQSKSVESGFGRLALMRIKSFCQKTFTTHLRARLTDLKFAVTYWFWISRVESHRCTIDKATLEQLKATAYFHHQSLQRKLHIQNFSPNP